MRCSDSRESGQAQWGFTAVEMVITLAAGSILLAAVLITQLQLSRHGSRITDSATRDNEIRTALDVMNRDIAGAGFLLEAAAPPVCNQVLAYNAGLQGMKGNAASSLAPGYFLMSPAMAFPATPGSTLPVAPITFAYSPGAGNRSDALVLRVTEGASVLNSQSYATLKAASTGTPASDGIFSLMPTFIPLLSPGAFDRGHAALVRVQNGTQPICLRVPIQSSDLTTSPPTLITANSSSMPPTSAPPQLMPPAYYLGFSAQMARFGMPANGVSNQNLAGPGAGASASLMDLGLPEDPTNTQFGYVYYVDRNANLTGNLATVPVLRRARVNSLNDTVGQTQDIAFGVVSLQVNFGVDKSFGANGGAVTDYLSGADVQSQNLGVWVRTVRMLIVTRSLNEDPSYIASPASDSSQPHFTNENAPELDLKTQFPNPIDSTKDLYQNYTIAPADYGYHFTAQEQEIALRNQAWMGTWSANLN